MKIKKVFNGNPNITIINKKGDILKMYYQGNNVCLENTNYKKSNVFHIVKNEPLYPEMKILFSKIKSLDKLCYLKGNNQNTKFEWVSDEENFVFPNHLTIYETSDGYRIQFMKNKLDTNGKCIVKFALSKSRNPEIAKAFDELLASNLCEPLYEVTKKYIKR